MPFDGKLTWSGHDAAQLSCKQQRHEGKRDDYTLMAQRACLVSSSARPCVAQTIIAKDAGEANTFERTFTFVLKHFRRSFEFVGAKQLWRVRQTKTRNVHGRVVVEVEDRHFITNRLLGAAHALTLVRLHWGMDMVLGEDDGVPCEKGNGIIVTSWLRLLAYNLVSSWHQKLPPVRDEIVTTWERSRDWLRDAPRTLDASHATLF